MKKLIHISDLHFGRVDYRTVSALEKQIRDLRPDVIAVSGDLTQRARSAQFRAAANFLTGLKFPQVVVPGNHDVPLYNLASRFLSPYEKFQSYIGDTEPFYEDEGCVVAGINTAHGLTIGQGRVSPQSLQNLRERLKPETDNASKTPEKIRVLVSHHPLDLFEPDEKRVKKNRVYVPAARHLLPDVLLAGHLHRSSAATTAFVDESEHRRFIVVQCGTSTSTRHRGETNCFNELHLDGKGISVHRWSFDAVGEKFSLDQTVGFELKDRGWQKIGES